MVFRVRVLFPLSVQGRGMAGNSCASLLYTSYTGLSGYIMPIIIGTNFETLYTHTQVTTFILYTYLVPRLYITVHPFYTEPSEVY